MCIRDSIFTNLFTFPLFMFTYVPLTVAALFLKVDWVPTPQMCIRDRPHMGPPVLSCRLTGVDGDE